MLKSPSNIILFTRDILSFFGKQRPIIFREKIKPGTIKKLRKISKNPTLENLESLQKNTIVNIAQVMIEKKRMPKEKLELFNNEILKIVNYICNYELTYTDLILKGIDPSQIRNIRTKKENGNYTIKTLHDIEIKIKD